MSLYQEKKVLIVEDFPEFRMGIRQMLVSLKVSDIHMASTGEEALQLCQKYCFDIILCDYNLGEGKDGQQLLEELRAYSLLKYRSIFILITAENTVFMVMGALENSPDAYLTKPFTRQDLKVRLDRLLALKDEVEAVNNALDNRDTQAALRACDEILDVYPKLATYILRLKASILLKSGEIEAANEVFTMVMNARPVIWAQFGLAKVLYINEEYEQSQQHLEAIIDKNENFLEAYDLLAETLVARGDAKDAQQVLSRAISKSAKSPKRQHRLGELARDNHDIDTATRALKRTVELSKNGMHENPQNVLDYAEILKDKAAQDESLAGKRAGTEALNVLNKFKKQIRNDPNTNVYSKILESRIYRVQNKEREAIESAKDAAKLHKGVAQDVGPNVVAELASTLLDCGEFKEAANLLSQLEKMDINGLDNKNKIQAIIDDLMKNEELREFHNSLNENNKKGVEFYDEGLLSKAINEFRHALESAENSMTINLNLIQSLIKVIQVTGAIDLNNLNEVETCFERIGQVEKTNPRYSRYEDLRQLYQGYKTNSENIVNKK